MKPSGAGLFFGGSFDYCFNLLSRNWSVQIFLFPHDSVLGECMFVSRGLCISSRLFNLLA